jgi:hypothetical protein
MKWHNTVITRPFYRTVRQFVDGYYSEGGRSLYIRHPSYADEPSNYIQAFLIIQKDLQTLFEYIHPADQNLNTYSFRTYEMLLRICTEIEANFKAIFRANTYSMPNGSWNIRDYVKIDQSHYLSEYVVKIPYWTAGTPVREPFAEWKNGHTLAWYRAYNTSKHDRAQELRAATFASVIDAFCGLSAVITAQFLSHDFGPANGVLTDPGIGDGYEEGIGQYVRLKYPSSVPSADRYDFKWTDLKTASHPFQKFDYDAV